MLDQTAQQGWNSWAGAAELEEQLLRQGWRSSWAGAAELEQLRWNSWAGAVALGQLGSAGLEQLGR